MLQNNEIKQEIKNRLNTYTGADIEMKLRQDRQNRLCTLVDKYGLENVALAGGITNKTLQHYIRVKVPCSIAETTVVQAESILKGL